MTARGTMEAAEEEEDKVAARANDAAERESIVRMGVGFAGVESFV